jgi:hypothetical protein
VVPEDGVLLFSNGYLCTTKLGIGQHCTSLYSSRSGSYCWDQNFVASFYAHGQTAAILADATGSNCEHLCFVELLDTALGQENTAAGLGLSAHSLDEDAIEKRREGLDGLDG